MGTITGELRYAGRTYDCRVTGRTYNSGGGRAIEIYVRDPEDDMWEPWSTATVNLSVPPPDGSVWIKEYDDYGTTRENLVRMRVIDPVPVGSTPSGFVTISAYRLTPKGLSLWHESTDEFKVGDRVVWADPDGDTSDGWTVVDVKKDEDPDWDPADTIYVIDNVSGSEAEVYGSEISRYTEEECH